MPPASNVINISPTDSVVNIGFVSGYGVFVPQLRRPFGAAEKAVPRHHGSGDQTSTRNGGTAYGPLSTVCRRRDGHAALVLAILGLLSHTAGLEASAAGHAAAPRQTLAAAAVAVRLAGHDLVRRRLHAGALRDRPRLLRRLTPAAPAPGPNLRRLREGPR